MIQGDFGNLLISAQPGVCRLLAKPKLYHRSAVTDVWRRILKKAQEARRTTLEYESTPRTPHDACTGLLDMAL
jgi:hypothetical protein